MDENRLEFVLEKTYRIVDVRDFNRLSEVLDEYDPQFQHSFDLTLQISSGNSLEWVELLRSSGIDLELNVQSVQALKFFVDRSRGSVEVLNENRNEELAEQFLPLCEAMLVRTKFSYDLTNEESAMKQFLEDYKTKSKKSGIFEFIVPTYSATMNNLKNKYDSTITNYDASLEGLDEQNKEKFVLRYRIDNGNITLIQTEDYLTTSLQIRFLYLTLNAYMLNANY